jgi:hypothetical protein
MQARCQNIELSDEGVPTAERLTSRDRRFFLRARDVNSPYTVQSPLVGRSTLKYVQLQLVQEIDLEH